MVMLAKGNRGKDRDRFVQAARRVLPGVDRRAGGPAGQGQHHEPGVVAYPELGMEAIYKITVQDFPGLHPGRRQGERFLRENIVEMSRPEDPGAASKRGRPDNHHEGFL